MDNYAYARRSRMDIDYGRSLPHPFPNAAPMLNRLGDIVRRGSQDLKSLKKVRLARAIRPDQDIQRPEFNRLRGRSETQTTCQVDTFDEHRTGHSHDTRHKSDPASPTFCMGRP